MSSPSADDRAPEMAAPSVKSTVAPKSPSETAEIAPKEASQEDDSPTQPASEEDPRTEDATAEPSPSSRSSSGPAPKSSSAAADRLARFKSLQARAKSSSKANLQAAAAESRQLATDGSALAATARKHAIASHELLKADTEAAGEDFERKRAWDWTAEESAAWDRRVAKKQRHRDDVAFADYTREAAKTYKRQVREMERAGRVDAEAYVAAKAEAVRRAAEQGGLQLVEGEDGELVAIDRDGRFAIGGSGAASMMPSDFADSKPSKEGVDRLVADLKKAEEHRLKARRGRRAADDGPDITYVNEKNKQFNMKLARFYNKYTVDIRESFERGTMI